MADKLATHQEAAIIGGIGTKDNKLITYQELGDYACRLRNGAQSYENNQCVLLKDLVAYNSSISGWLSISSAGNLRAFEIHITSSPSGVSYNYGPSGAWWNYYSSIPANYIKSGMVITINAEGAAEYSGVGTQQMDFGIGVGAIVDNKSLVYIEKTSGSSLFDNESIRLNTNCSNLGEAGGSWTTARYRCHFDITNTTYVDVICNVRNYAGTLFQS